MLDEAVRHVGDRLLRAPVQLGVPPRPRRTPWRGRRCRTPGPRTGRHEHLVTGGAQPLGGVEDAGTDPEDGVDEHDVGHGPTQPAPTDSVQRRTGHVRAQTGCSSLLRDRADCHPRRMDTESVYDAVGGTDGLTRLAHAWHVRCLADPIVSHAFEGGFHDDHSERLAAYWGEALGGPAAYTSAYGDESTVVRLHSGNGVHEEMDRRAIACFDSALADVGLSPESGAGRLLHGYFAWATTTTMTAYHSSPDDVPDGLALPRWSWDGLQPEPSLARDGTGPRGTAHNALGTTGPGAVTGGAPWPRGLPGSGRRSWRWGEVPEAGLPGSGAARGADGPLLLVDDEVVALADQHEVVEVGAAVTAPEADVVGAAPIRQDGAAREQAAPSRTASALRSRGVAVRECVRRRGLRGSRRGATRPSTPTRPRKRRDRTGESPRQQESG